jgi:hemolysin activation/secretion protein
LGSALASAQAGPPQTFYISEYNVEGTRLLSKKEIERAVYPYLGPGRLAEDVDKARAALEKAYRDKGYQTVFVQIPEQDATGGVITLNVVEAPVGQLKVKNATFVLPSRIRRRAPSLAPGQVPNWADVERDIVALNRGGDLRVTPSLSEGIEPGTVDVELDVQDKFPLHGSIELNNRYTQDTTELRVNGSLSYTNLWQAGHAIGASFQVAPQRPEDAQVFSGYYLLPLPGAENVSLLAQYTRQDSDISTLGGTGVIGKGDMASFRAIFTLPQRPGFYHNLSVGLDYKDFMEDVKIGASSFQTPITYYPASVAYNATWIGKKYETELATSVTWAFRGLGSDILEFDNKRYNADGAFIALRGQIGHLHTLPADFQVFGRLQGQLADGPLINNEQYSGGGLTTARGYIESSALGDNGGFATVELRSPSFFGAGEEKPNEWRVYAFADIGLLGLYDTLPDQDDRFEFASIGAGTYLRLFDHLHGSLDVGVPLTNVAGTQSGDPLLTFRLWAEF